MRRILFASLLLLSPILYAAPPHIFRTITRETPGGGGSGTLRYQRGEVIITGRVVYRTTYYGDFLMRFTDAAHTTLLELRQDNSYAVIEGRLIGGRWEGPVNSAPLKLRGWISLSRLFVNEVQGFSVHTAVGEEKFEFRFP